MRLLLLMALCAGSAWAGDTVIKETDGYGNEKPGKIVVQEDGKIYRVGGYGHRAEAGYLQIKEDGKTAKAVDGYGHERPGRLVVKEDGKVCRYDGYGDRAEAGYLQVKGDKIYKVDAYDDKTLVGKVEKRKK
jgi:hypothetical protein